MTTEFVTTVELARRLGVPVNTVHFWRARRTGPKGARLGKHVVYRWADVETWFAERVAADPVNEDPKFRTRR